MLARRHSNTLLLHQAPFHRGFFLSAPASWQPPYNTPASDTPRSAPSSRTASHCVIVAAVLATCPRIHASGEGKHSGKSPVHVIAHTRRQALSPCDHEKISLSDSRPDTFRELFRGKFQNFDKSEQIILFFVVYLKGKVAYNDNH